MQIRYDGITGGPAPTDLEATVALFQKLGLPISRRDYAAENYPVAARTRAELEALRLGGSLPIETRPAKTTLVIHSRFHTGLYFTFDPAGKLLDTDADTDA